LAGTVGRPERDLRGADTRLTRFARELRTLRAAAGHPSYRQLSAATHYSAATLARAAAGQTLPSLEVTLAYVAGCGGDLARWREAWAQAALQQEEPPASPEPVAGPPAGATPAQLPPDTADFTGREEQVARLCGLLGAQTTGPPGAVVISAVAGMGGIGKTTLAVHVAHQVRAQFPDGQLYVSLRGAASPLSPAEVLARFLRDLGEPDCAIPAGEAERTAQYRTILAERRVLVVLDDASDTAQVTPLLPGSAGCAVLVTSRPTLAGLPGATLLDLDVLSPPEAYDLFCAIAGRKRAAAEPEATADVVACCAGLPLAVRIAASRLAARPHWSVGHLAARLACQRARLAELAVGDLAVRASFSVSYHALSATGPDSARVFRLLGLPAAAELGLAAIAALTGKPAAQVAVALEILTDAHLLQSPVPDRYRLHDLIRRYAVDLCENGESEQDRDAALRRLLTWYGEQAVIAARQLSPDREPLPSSLPVAVERADPAAALGWYEQERAGLLACAGQAAERGYHSIAVQIAWAMHGFFQRTPYLEDWLALNEVGARSARHLDDDRLLAKLLQQRGQAYAHAHRFWECDRSLEEALEIARRTGDQGFEIDVLNSLCGSMSYQGRLVKGLEYLRPALDLATESGQQERLALTLSNFGHVLVQLGRSNEALDYLRRALRMRQDMGVHYYQGLIGSTLGEAYLNLGRFGEALRQYERALDVLRENGREHPAYADVLCGLGQSLAGLGRVAEARQAWLEALPVLDRIGDPRAAEIRAWGFPAQANGPDVALSQD
jgi:tetratricopeptide (TPR) repeat protein